MPLTVLALAAFLSLVLTSCSSIVGETPVAYEGSKDGKTSSTATTRSTGRECVRFTGGTSAVHTGSLAGDALALSGEIFICADDVVVVATTHVNEVIAAAQLAAALGGPLLHPHPQLAAEIGRLKPDRIHVVGDVDLAAPPGAELHRHPMATAVEHAAVALGTGEEKQAPVEPDVATIVETVLAMRDRDRVVTPQNPPDGSTSPSLSLDAGALIEGLAVPTESESVWLVDASDPKAVISVTATGRAIGASVAAIDTEDILAHPIVGEVLASRPPESIRFVGGPVSFDSWDLAVLARGVQVPGGGFRVLPDDQPRRYVAFYGHPDTTGLGVLGEQRPKATLTRMAPLLDAYGADGYQVIPTFEIIASVASAGPTEDNDYSFEWPISTFEEWIRVAEENDVYVVLDLQPGREDFLSQAKQYEDLLMLPNVGLALDPEWRLKPDQVHLRQVGQVQAAEVNQVVEWLANLVRDNSLPQKMLIVHQFQTRMILDREMLEERPELQMIIQMDGQGPIATKDETYAELTRGTEGVHWSWGWKNFFDEDSPTPTPDYTINKSPVPIFVSYQ